MKILVVGSGGVGAAFAPIAARRDFYDHIVFADIDEARAQGVVDRFGAAGTFSAAKVDATDAADVTAVAKANGIDAILNAADPRFVPGIFQGAFDAGATYGRRPALAPTLRISTPLAACRTPPVTSEKERGRYT